MNLLTLLWLGVLGVEDLKKKKVSSFLLLAGGTVLCTGSVYHLFAKQGNMLQMLAAVIPGALLLFLTFATGKIGAADGLAVLFLGLLVGADRAWMMLSISLICMALICVLLLVLKKADRQTEIPFLPFLFLGCGGSFLLGGGL